MYLGEVTHRGATRAMVPWENDFYNAKGLTQDEGKPTNLLFALRKHLPKCSERSLGLIYHLLSAVIVRPTRRTEPDGAGSLRPCLEPRG